MKINVKKIEVLKVSRTDLRLGRRHYPPARGFFGMMCDMVGSKNYFLAMPLGLYRKFAEGSRAEMITPLVCCSIIIININCIAIVTF
jgi:hypothetical protein